MRSYHFPDYATASRSYDLQGCLIDQTLGAYQTTGLAYDANGKVLTRNTASDSHGYGYDPLDRVIEENADGTFTGYDYDEDGNRLLKSAGTTFNTAISDPMTEKEYSKATDAGRWDNNGCRVGKSILVELDAPKSFTR
ncbi:MAG: hypothetical protein ACU833_13390 [Gammaproteobacteria bacterium]